MNLKILVWILNVRQDNKYKNNEKTNTNIVAYLSLLKVNLMYSKCTVVHSDYNSISKRLNYFKLRFQSFDCTNAQSIAQIINITTKKPYSKKT